MHDVIAAHPKWQALEAQRRKLREAERASIQRVQDAMEPYRQERAKWEGERNATLLKGKPPPPEPQPPDLGADVDAPRVFAREHERLRREERRVLAEIADEVERAAAEREPAIREQARAHKQGLIDCAAELAALVSAVRTVRQAVERRDPNVIPHDGPSSRTRRTVTARDLLDVPDSRSLLEPAPPRARTSHVQSEPTLIDVHDGQVTYGLKGSFGRPPAPVASRSLSGGCGGCFESVGASVP